MSIITVDTREKKRKLLASASRDEYFGFAGPAILGFLRFMVMDRVKGISTERQVASREGSPTDPLYARLKRWSTYLLGSYLLVAERAYLLE